MTGEGFWSGKRVFVTGHTGFKGSWLCLWLHELGACVHGYALEPATEPALFRDAAIPDIVDRSVFGNILDAVALHDAVERAQPEVVFHLAAQPLVRASYADPVGTYATNVLGTARVLDTVRTCPSVRAVVNVTTDKVYENRESGRAYCESDTLGGADPYSSSKACSELVTAAYRDSFFNPRSFDQHRVSIGTARSGNVVGGGDWARDRLVPDAMRAFRERSPVRLRYPRSTRPWQHVLEPLRGYLLLAERLCSDGKVYSGAWNFGPRSEDSATVRDVMVRLSALWGDGAAFQVDSGEHPHEAAFLALDSTKASARLGWRPRWNLGTCLEKTVEWYKEFIAGSAALPLCISQIREYEGGAS